MQKPIIMIISMYRMYRMSIDNMSALCLKLLLKCSVYYLTWKLLE